MGNLPKPLRDYVLARPVKPETKTASGFILPDNTNKETDEAVVKALGKDVKEIKVNDVITYKSYGPIKKKIGADEYILIREEEVAAIN